MQRKALLLAAFAGLLCLAAWSFRAVAPDPVDLLSRKDAARIEYEKYVERFDDHRYGFVSVRHPASPDVVAVSGEITQFLLGQPAVSRVVSPQNARYFLGSEYFSFTSLFPRGVLVEDARDRLRLEVWRRTLFPDRPESFVTLFEYSSSATRAQERELVLSFSTLLERLERTHSGVEVGLAGPRLHQAARTLKTSHSLTLIVAFLVGMAVAAGLAFSSPTIAAWALVSNLVTAASVLLLLRVVSGGFGPFGFAIMQGSLSVSLGCTLTYFALLLSGSGRLSQRTAEAARQGERPLLMFSAALVSASLGLLTSKFMPIREAGAVFAMSCVLGWLITFRVLPTALAEFGFHPKSHRVPFSKRLHRKKKTQARSILAAAACLLAFLLSSFAATRVRPGETLFLTVPPPSKVELLVKPKYWDVFDADNQAELLALEQKIADLPGVDRVASLSGLSDDLFSTLAMRKPGQGEKLRKELLTTLDELGALSDFRAAKAKEARTVVWLKPGGDYYKDTVEGIDGIYRQSQGRITVQLAGIAALRKALSAP